MKASDIVVDKNISILMKSPWGHGKTLAAASFALDGPIYMAYFDKSKPIELKTYFSKFGEQGAKILRNIEYDIYGAHNANMYLNKVIEMAKDCRYTAVITDSVTNLTSAAVNWSLSFREDRKNKERLKVIPDWDEYKVETSLVTQVIDLFRGMPIYTIFTAHPIPSVRIEGSGNTVKVTKVNPIVSYGSKVGAIIPGSFSEIYHFSKQSGWDTATGTGSTKYLVSMDSIGDDFAKSNLGLTGELDITNGFFYEIWKNKLKEALNEVKTEPINPNESINPFDKPKSPW